LYPSVCLQAINEEVSTNFLGSCLDPFIFDLDSLQTELQTGYFISVRSLPSDPLSLHDLVKSYLIHYGYIEALQAMETQDDESLMI
jgi:hypothetical protein